MNPDEKRRHFIFWTAAAAGLVADLVSKSLVFDWLKSVELTERIVISGFFALRQDENTGTFFSLLRDSNEWLIVFTVVMMAAVIGMFLAPPKELRLPGKGRLYALALGLVLAGAAGNLWDRAWYGHVRDFLSCGFGAHRWPTFNLADAWLTLGIIAYLIASLRAAREEPPAPAGKGPAR
jgi:signal peptidase II